MNDDTYARLALAIIKGQEEIIGPMAWQQASSVPGITISSDNSSVLIGQVDKKTAIDDLVQCFKTFFGQAAIEVCKEAAMQLTPQMSREQLPKSLQ